MKINLESSWDYYRKLNLVILLVISLGINLGFTFFEKFNLNLFLILTLINVLILFILLLKKSIQIENNTINAFHSLFGLKIKTINSLPLKNNSSTEFKKFKSRNYYQNDNKFEPTLHVEENIFNIIIDGNLLITIYNNESKENFLKFFSKLNTEY
ncbi:hypothetical protein [Flavobacterium sp.]